MIHVEIFTFNPMQENTYLLWNEKGRAIIIDPGCYFTNEQETLEKFIKKKNLKPVQLLNTHCHLDHVFGIKWIAKTYQLELFIHPNEERVLEFAPATGIMWGFGYDPYNGAFHFLRDGDSISFDDDKLEVIFTPGHSPGSICFYCRKQNFLIGGDVLFLESIGRTDLPGGNHQQLLNSIQKQLFILPDETVVYPGHGPATSIGHEKKYNPFLNGLA
ncbi:MAG TPA: MBL fold metallo-hydrolase [Chitinophagaceae bacterium]|jgi:glyoxylase-like metal-dependent hydrolase (beta-lactamase superfamily II)